MGDDKGRKKRISKINNVLMQEYVRVTDDVAYFWSSHIDWGVAVRACVMWTKGKLDFMLVLI